MTRTLTCITAAAVVAASAAFSAQASAEPRPTNPPAPKTCPNKGKPFKSGSGNTLIEVQACRAVTKIDGDMKWRGYGSVRIGPQTKPANGCEFLVYTGTRKGGKDSLQNPDRHDCAPALRKGYFFTYFDRDPDADEDTFVTFTRVCVRISNNRARIFDECVNSNRVLTAEEPR